MSTCFRVKRPRFELLILPSRVTLGKALSLSAFHFFFFHLTNEENYSCLAYL